MNQDMGNSGPTNAGDAQIKGNCDMISSLKSSCLEKFYAFFDTTGKERLGGLDRSYFDGISEADRQEAWHFLVDDFARSPDAITGLYLLDNAKSVALFKAEIDAPMPTTPFSALRRMLESNRLLMLKYINKHDPDPTYINAVNVFANSEFEEIRGEFARAVPVAPVTRGVVDALKRMIFTETECIPITSAITKLMVIHGMDFDRHDPVYKSIFNALRSNDPNDKIAGMTRLQQQHTLDYLDE
jgi:hypothetical protein